MLFSGTSFSVAAQGFKEIGRNGSLGSGISYGKPCVQREPVKVFLFQDTGDVWKLIKKVHVLFGDCAVAHTDVKENNLENYAKKRIYNCDMVILFCVYRCFR